MTAPPSPSPPWLLDADRRVAEPEEYDSELGQPMDDVGHVLPIVPVETGSPGLEGPPREEMGAGRGQGGEEEGGQRLGEGSPEGDLEE